MTAADAARRPARKPARKIARREVFRLSESPSHLLRRIEQFAAETFLKAGLLDGVTLRQAVLLAAIAEAEGASQSDLVRTTGVDRSTLAEMMARMERKGLIARSAAADDGRAKSVSLTSEGRDRLDDAFPAMKKVDEALLAALSGSKRAAFQSTLLALAATAEAHGVDTIEERPARKTAVKRPGRATKKKKGR
jgi:DNA-binding MarR family transcriptional regulator